MEPSPSEDIPQKQCPACKQFFPATSDYFSQDRYKLSGFKSRCKSCQSAYDMAQYRKRKEHRQPVILPEGIQKQCRRCNQFFSATSEYFQIDRDEKDGLKSHCKICSKKQLRIRYLARKEQIDMIACPDKLTCPACGETKPSDQFHKAPNQKYGRALFCKACADKMNRARREITPSYKIKERERYKSMSPEQKAQRQASSLKWRREHKDYLARYSQEQRHLHPEVFRARWQRWAKTENGYEHCRIRVRNRRARRKGAQGNYTHADIVKQREKQENKCIYCGAILAKYHIDHVTPLSRGGTNNPDNLVLTCPTCNLQKGTKLLHEWMKQRDGR